MQTTQIIVLILMALATVGFVCWQAGMMIGRMMAEREVIQYCQENPMNLTTEVMRDLYPQASDLPTLLYAKSIRQHLKNNRIINQNLN